MRSIRGSSCACFILQPAKAARPVSVSNKVTCWHCTAPSSGLLHYELPQLKRTSRHCYARLLPFGRKSGRQAPRVLRPRAARTSRAAALSEPSLRGSPPRQIPTGIHFNARLEVFPREPGAAGEEPVLAQEASEGVRGACVTRALSCRARRRRRRRRSRRGRGRGRRSEVLFGFFLCFCLEALDGFGFVIAAPERPGSRPPGQGEQVPGKQCRPVPADCSLCCIISSTQRELIRVRKCPSIRTRLTFIHTS